MTQEEWLKEFIRLNGRPATQAEFNEGWALYQAKYGAPAQQQPTQPQTSVQEPVQQTLQEQTTTATPVAPVQAQSTQMAQPLAPQAYAQPAMAYPQFQVPTPKKSKMPWIIGGVTAALAIVGIVLGIIFLSQPKGIQGVWHMDMAQMAKEHEEIPGEMSSSMVDFQLVVRGNTADMVGYVDFDKMQDQGHLTEYDSVEDYVDELNYYDDQERYSYNQSTGMVEFELMKNGRVDEKYHKISYDGVVITYDFSGNSLTLYDDDSEKMYFKR